MDTQSRSPQAPFIIWTLRRTGGTHFGQALFEYSPFESVQHEPFNVERVFGPVTRRWLKHCSEERLRTDIESICARRVLMKHCLENVPDHLNRVLAETSTRAGYRHLFLYRKRPGHRLLSLTYARRSGAWAKEHVKQAKSDDEVFRKPLPVDDLVGHEIGCRKRMRAVHEHLKGLGADPVVVTFEELYTDPSTGGGRERAHDVMKRLGLARDDAQDGLLLDQVFCHKGQGTRHKYVRFSNCEQLNMALAGLGTFELQTRDIQVEYTPVDRNRVEQCIIWKPVAEPRGKHYTIRGIVLPARSETGRISVFLEDGEGRKPVSWGLPSEKIAALHPENPWARNARFEQHGVIFGDGPVRLVIEAAERQRVVLAEMS